MFFAAYHGANQVQNYKQEVYQTSVLWVTACITRLWLDAFNGIKDTNEYPSTTICKIARKEYTIHTISHTTHLDRGT